MTSRPVPGGVVHALDITPLARNEFICWVLDAKQDATRQRPVRRTREELTAGQRRPCCWPGCTHRTADSYGSGCQGSLI